jgi:hypothetical protein
MAVLSASFAVSSSRAITASVALNNITTASVTSNTITFTKGDGTTFPIIVSTGSISPTFPFTGSAIISGSLRITGSTSITGSFTVSAGAPDELVVTSTGIIIGNSITDAHSVTGSINISGSITVQGALNTTTTILASVTGSGRNLIAIVSTASYDSIYIDYNIKSGSNARAGTFIAIWSGSIAQYTDYSTTDFGNTAGVIFAASISSSNLIVTGSTSTPNWRIKSIIRSI